MQTRHHQTLYPGQVHPARSQCSDADPPAGPSPAQNQAIGHAAVIAIGVLFLVIRNRQEPAIAPVPITHRDRPVRGTLDQSGWRFSA
jgi:hypothetical protein